MDKELLYSEQEYRCAICRGAENEELFFSHDDSTELLCYPCFSIVNGFLNNPERIGEIIAHYIDTQSVTFAKIFADCIRHIQSSRKSKRMPEIATVDNTNIDDKRTLIITVTPDFHHLNQVQKTLLIRELFSQHERFGIEETFLVDANTLKGYTLTVINGYVQIPHSIDFTLWS